jgi:hypothetical protein
LSGLIYGTNQYLRGRIRKIAGKSLVILKWIQDKSWVNLNHGKSFYVKEGTLIVEVDVMIIGFLRSCDRAS